MLRSLQASEFPPERVLELKRGRTVSVVIPARDEEATVGAVVGTIRQHLIDRHHIVDEVIVVDDGSRDATAAVATRAGATVVGAAGVLTEYGDEHGKGQAMWRGLHLSVGDVVVFCDADVTNFHPGFVLGLAGPLLARDELGFVKAFYRRPYMGRPGEGGRVTELAARPALSLLFPHLAGVAQPLAGECAGRREVLEAVPFAGGYGVDVGLVIDVAAGWGVDAIAQCDLGERVHRNRPLSELGPQARAVLAVILARAGVEAVEGARVERPPLAEVPSHRKTA